MKTLKFTLASALCCAIFTTAQAQPVSFSQAWVLLQKQNNSLAAGRANVDRYQNLEQARDSLNLPSVTLGARYTILDDEITLDGNQILESTGNSAGPILSPILGSIVSEISGDDVFSSSVRAVWPIFTGGKISAVQGIARAQTEEAEAELNLEKSARYEDLSKYYFGVVLANQVLNTYISVEKGLSQHVDFARKLEKQGQIAKVERLQAEASLAKARVDRKKSARNLEIAISALTQILNQNESVQPTSDLFINATLPPLGVYKDQTLDTFPGLAILNAKEKQAQGLASAEKGKYYPDVYLYGDYKLYEEDDLLADLTPDWFVGIGVNLPLVETSGRSDRLQAAYSAMLQVDHLRAQVQQDLSVLVKKTYLEAEQSVEEVYGLDVSIELARENLKLRKKAFSQGLSNSLDVVDAQNYLAAVQTQQHVAKFNYLIALNKLLALTGKMNTFEHYEGQALQHLEPGLAQGGK